MVKLILVILFSFNISYAYDVNIYDSAEKGRVVIELVDDCSYSHKLVIDLDRAATFIPHDWFELLVISGEWNKCKKSS
jgi:hypothetical protein